MGDAELARVRRLVHAMCCRDRASVHLAAQQLTAYGIQRGAGEIEQDLRAASCEICASHPSDPGSQPSGQQQLPATIHQAGLSGGLTDMIERDG